MARQHFPIILLSLFLAIFIIACSGQDTRINENTNQTNIDDIAVNDNDITDNSSSDQSAKELEPLNQSAPEETKACKDTDEGLDYNNLGAVNDISEDFCTKDILTEYYCSNDSVVTSINYSCTDEGLVCRGGACIPFNTKAALIVSTSPEGSFVFIDTISRGKTPITIKPLSMGKHSIMVSKPGFETYTGSLDLGPGNNTLTINMTARKS